MTPLAACLCLLLLARHLFTGKGWWAALFGLLSVPAAMAFDGLAVGLVWRVPCFSG